MDKPPYTNGVMSNPPCTKADLQTIIEGFTPSKNFNNADTFYIVSTWNTQHPTTPINGDTVENLLK